MLIKNNQKEGIVVRIKIIYLSARTDTYRLTRWGVIERFGGCSSGR